MKIAKYAEVFVKMRNRVVSRLTKRAKQILLDVECFVLLVLGTVLNLLDRKLRHAVHETEFSVRNAEQGVTVNCMGGVDADGYLSYGKELDTLSDVLSAGELSFASLLRNKDMNLVHKTAKLLQSHGITVISSETMMRAELFRSEIGKIGVISYERFIANDQKRHVKVDFMRYYLALKKQRPDYVIVYVENKQREKKLSAREVRLYKLLARIGADYIVGVTPNQYSDGTTYLKKNGDAARSVYSLGMFLSPKEQTPPERVILRIRLKKVSGKLRLVDETYIPYCRTAQHGFVSLIDGDESLLPLQNRYEHRGRIERELQRIRPIDRMLTLGKLMEIIGTPLPAEYLELAPFSVGKVCARSFDVMPGDVFFFREAFDDPNDLEPVSPKRRLRIAKTAAKRGALVVMTFQKLPFRCRQIPCGNVMEAHIAACAYLRKQLRVRVIGITGSIGKTSTKDMLAEVMGTQFATVKSERNANVQVKIGENLQKITSHDQIYIQEIGGGRPGGASRHARMVLPEVTVVTNIGDAHIGNFGSKEKLMENKIRIIEGMQQDGVLYLNGDDPLLATATPACRTVFYAVHNKQADYYAENIREEGTGTFFDIVHKDGRASVHLNVLGEYNVLNAVCCYAIGQRFGVPQELILKGLDNFRTTGIRQNFVEACGRKFFMDCYNASSDSVKSAMDILSKVVIGPDNKRIAVIGDITGMGELTEQVHLEIGRTLAQYSVDHLILFGKFIRITYDYLKSQGIEARYISDREELNRTLKEIVGVGDVAAFKGSSKVLLEYSVDMTFGTCMTDQRLLDEREYRRVRLGGITYNLFEHYATAVKFSSLRGTQRKVRLAEHVAGIPVVNLERTFAETQTTGVSLPHSIRHIGEEAFLECGHLTELKLPHSLKYIGARAFMNCTALRTVKIPEGVYHIDAEAFSGCTGMKEIVIPASVVYIGKDAFAGCTGCRFVYPKGSYAEAYFKSTGAGE